ncbi:MAG: hypothetical protein M3020_11035 [Myxococcota bacterium]|jgi:hypothetical protein|nr:hypothetical protein [Myxococcota bacterium]
MRIPVALLVSAAFLLGCENRERHQALAKDVKKTAARLCQNPSSNKEGGGCNADCRVMVRAKAARQSILAAKELARLPKIEDPETETLLVGLRGAARDVLEKLESACPVPIVPDEPLTDAIRACARAAGAAEAGMAKQRRLFEAFADDVEDRVGVQIKVASEDCRN